MAEIIFVTNMEPHYVGMRDALNAIEDKEISNAVEVIQINDSEQWNGYWKQKLQGAKFFFCTWMGTGLSCDYLKKASAFLQQKKLCHLFDIIDPGDDKMDYGLQEEQKSLLKEYLACGGLKNYQNLCLYLVAAFTQQKGAYKLPEHLPWCGIYHPEFKHEFVELDAYLAKHYDSSKPTVGFIFSREDWLWQRLAYQNEIIKAIEAQNCNVIAVFSTTMPNEKTGAVSLATAFERFFYKNGLPCIDVLINPFVFSLTVTGFLKLRDLQQLGVPVLQVVNTYMPSKWWQQSMVGLTPNEVSYAVCMPEFDGALHSVPVSTNEEREDGTHYRMPLADRIDMLARKARKLASLRYKKPCEKKIAIVFHNYPPTNSNIGSAASLDSIESVRLLLEEMQKQGYRLDNIPTGSQSFINDITAHATNDRRFISEALLEKADGKLVHRELSYRFFIGNTCGCTKHVPFDTESFRNRIFWKNLQEYDAKSKLDSMQEWVTSRISLEEIMDATGRFLDLVGAGRGQIFLTDDLFSQEAKSYRSCKREVLNWCNEKNRTEEGVVQVFMPLHYQLHRMGYCMVAGVDEMFRTGILETFFRNICYALENYIQRKQYQEVNLKLQKLYRIDQLTGIYNRFGMEDLGQKFYEKNCEYHVNTKFIFCDINRLKYINDTYGHKAGDWVIRKTGEALGRLTAEDSLPFRFGGDEFLLLTREESGITAESIRQSIAVVCGEETSPIRESLEVSIGVILAPWDSEYNMDVYLNQADEAMYEEKKMYHEKYGDRRRR